ncbi:unnamed protein product [Orchesella dallaii]|uniref:Uncharacterized protein n=1 Tax=Orchesella dallaii TaxID=48710 RepID=A0ABP1Q317_9HEXA
MAYFSRQLRANVLDNPADLPSRGITTDLIKSTLWWHRPSCFHSPTFPVSCGILNMNEVTNEEKSKLVMTLHAVTGASFMLTWIHRFSTLKKLVTGTVVKKTASVYTLSVWKSMT